eukprot:scaffold21543_cov77-Skeletonema_marinoi.AAC.1
MTDDSTDSDIFSMRVTWKWAQGEMFVFVQPKSARDKLQQAMIAITTVMSTDSAFGNLDWNKLEKVLMEILGGTESEIVKRRGKNTVSGHTFTLTNYESAILELFRTYANKHNSGEGKRIALPKSTSKDQKLSKFVRNKKQQLDDAATNDKTKGKTKY